mmetsp:Transcript_16696/g.50609  ORF Transcript_16696/g.50609 Transcript_16696/m.50609 type:complete len:200 (-) Transcript_16696:113-712(-)
MPGRGPVGARQVEVLVGVARDDEPVGRDGEERAPDGPVLVLEEGFLVVAQQEQELDAVARQVEDDADEVAPHHARAGLEVPRVLVDQERPRLDVEQDGGDFLQDDAPQHAALDVASALHVVVRQPVDHDGEAQEPADGVDRAEDRHHLLPSPRVDVVVMAIKRPLRRSKIGRQVRQKQRARGGDVESGRHHQLHAPRHS